MMRSALRVAASLYLTAAALATVIGDHTCAVNKKCGSGSQICTPAGAGAACTYCDGATVVNMCIVSLGGSCANTGNLPCGNTWKGTCEIGGCLGGAMISGNCQVLGC